MGRTRKITNEKLREYQFGKGYATSLEGKRVEWDVENNVVHMWEEVKQAMVESAKEVFGSVRVWEKNPKSVWWNDKVKAVVKRKMVLAASDEEAKESCMETFREEKRKVNRCTYIRAKIK